jgi:hypothetical protein
MWALPRHDSFKRDTFKGATIRLMAQFTTGGERY